MLEHPDAVVAQRLAETAVGDDFLVELPVVERACADRCNDESEIQVTGHVAIPLLLMKG